MERSWFRGCCSTFVMRHCVSLLSDAAILSWLLSKQGQMKAQTASKINSGLPTPDGVVSKPRAANVLHRALKSIALPKRTNAVRTKVAVPKARGRKAGGKTTTKRAGLAGSVERRAAIGTVRAVRTDAGASGSTYVRPEPRRRQVSGNLPARTKQCVL